MRRGITSKASNQLINISGQCSKRYLSKTFWISKRSTDSGICKKKISSTTIKIIKEIWFN